MNYIEKHETGYNAGQFVLHNPAGQMLFSLGEEVVIVLRQLVVVPENKQQVKYLQYIVEIIESSQHEDTGFSSGRAVILRVPMADIKQVGNDARIAMCCFKGDAFGQTHRIALQEFCVDSNRGFVLTINGLLWDGQIIHVKDIAC